MGANWAYGLAQGLAAGAQSAVGSIDANLKEDAEKRAEDRKLEMAMRLRAADEMTTIRAEERKRAMALQQGKTIEEGATGLLNSGVASRINATQGSSIDPNNPESKATIEAIRNNPEAAKAYGLDEETDLTRARARETSARNVGDLAAAKEQEGSVRGMLQEKRDKERGERDERRLDIQEEYNRNREERQDAIQKSAIASQERRGKSDDARAEAAVSASQRAATATALKGVNDDIKALEKEAADLSTDPAKKAVIAKQLDSARQEAAGYRRSLGEAGLPKVDAPQSAPGSRPPLGSFDKGAPKSDSASTSTPGVKPGGMLATGTPKIGPDAGFTPPADSPVAKAQARDAEAKSNADAEKQSAFDAAQLAANAALAAKDPARAVEIQSMPGYSLLPRAVKTQIYALANARR